jgi:hypothetical protein
MRRKALSGRDCNGSERRRQAQGPIGRGDHRKPRPLEAPAPAGK